MYNEDIYSESPSIIWSSTDSNDNKTPEKLIKRPKKRKRNRKHQIIATAFRNTPMCEEIDFKIPTPEVLSANIVQQPFNNKPLREESPILGKAQEELSPILNQIQTSCVRDLSPIIGKRKKRNLLKVKRANWRKKQDIVLNNDNKTESLNDQKSQSSPILSKRRKLKQLKKGIRPLEGVSCIKALKNDVSTGSNADRNMRSDMDKNMGSNVDEIIRTNMDKDMSSYVDKNIRSNVDKDMRSILDKNIRSNMDKNMRNNMDKTMRNNMNKTLKTSVDKSIKSNKTKNINMNKKVDTIQDDFLQETTKVYNIEPVLSQETQSYSIHPIYTEECMIIEEDVTKFETPLEHKQSSMQTLMIPNRKDKSKPKSKGKRVRYRKDSLVQKLDKAVTAQESKVSIWKHEIFLGKSVEDSQLLKPHDKQLSLLLIVKKIWIEYGSGILECCDGKSALKCLVVFGLGQFAEFGFNLGDFLRVFPPYHEVRSNYGGEIVNCYLNVNKVLKET